MHTVQILKHNDFKNNAAEQAPCHLLPYTWKQQLPPIMILFLLFVIINPESHDHADFKWQKHLKQVKQHTWPSSMSLCMPGLSCSVLFVLLMERLCDLRFCLTWRAAALFPLSTGITPQWRPQHASYLKLSKQTASLPCLAGE